MGEAKRRRDQLGQPVRVFNLLTGAHEFVREGGDAEQLLSRQHALADALDRGERPVMPVPCQGCRSCCYLSKLDFNPALERDTDLAHLDYTVQEDGTARLRKREDGACVHLGETGCTVYEHRPTVCRVYDCRVQSLVGIVTPCDGGHVTPAWAFTGTTEKGRMFAQLLHLLGTLDHARRRKEGLEPSAQTALKFALENVDALTSAFTELKKLSPDELTAALGFDPRTRSPEDTVASARALFPDL
jgi:hypothetical protein